VLPVCNVGGAAAVVNFVGLISPGLYQLNLTIPATSASGDNAVGCTYNGSATPAGDLITVQASAPNRTLTITPSGTGSGTVSSSPAGTSCGAGCLSFAAGTAVTLTATPGAGSTFAGWSGACSGTGNCAVTMNSSQAVTATFNLTGAVNPSLTITTSGAGGGTVASSPVGTSCGSGCLSFAAGTVVTLTATPNTGSTFAGWFGACSGAGSCAVTMNVSQAVVAVFNQAGGQSPAITSLSSASLAPLNLLIIAGSGFDPTAQLQVTFFNSGFSVTVPAVYTTSTQVLASVPPFLDAQGNFGAGTVNISVSQTSSSGAAIAPGALSRFLVPNGDLSRGTGAMPASHTPYSGAAATSNALSGFQIRALPAASVLPAGTLTLALLNATLQAIGNLQGAVSGTSYGTPAMQSTLSRQATVLQNLIPQVQSVTNGQSTGFTMGQIDGSNVNVGLQDLATSDRLLVSLLTAFAGPTPDLSKLGVPTDVTTSNPVQAAAQAALSAVMNPATNPLQVNQASANFIGAYVQTNPTQATAALLMTAGVFGVVAFLPEGIGAGALALLAEGIGALTTAVSTTTIIVAIGGAVVGIALEACAQGYTLGSAFRDIVKTILTAPPRIAILVL